ncbi:MAG: YeeE/YedE thiosulfate transporter family protein [Candidatus Fermentibacteria bacterium]
MNESGSEKKGILRELFDIFFSKSWPMWVGGILLGVGNIALFIVLKPWGASGGIYVWGANLFNSVFGTGFGFKGGPLPPVELFPYSVICFLLFLGALGASLLSRQFAFRFPPIGEIFKGLIGGVIMGIGAMVGKSCTLGGYFSGIAALSVGAVVFTIGLGIGTWIAVKYLMFEINKFPKISSGKTASLLGAGKGKGGWQPIVGVLVLIFGLVIAFRYTGTSSVLAWYAAIGLFFGFVCQRSRFCLVRALREPFTSGDSKPAVAAIVGILVAMFGFTVIKFMGVRDAMLWVWPHFWVPAVLGGIKRQHEDEQAYALAAQVEVQQRVLLPRPKADPADHQQRRQVGPDEGQLAASLAVSVLTAIVLRRPWPAESPGEEEPR